MYYTTALLKHLLVVGSISIIWRALPSSAQLPLQCVVGLDPGGSVICRMRLERWWYNQNSGQCEQFMYSGCGGNDNNFLSQAQCDRACKSQKDIISCRVGDVYLDAAGLPISCNFFTNFARIGCPTNYECQQDTAGNFGCCPQASTICTLAANSGTTCGITGRTTAQLRWRYDAESKKCGTFLYFGCGGNGNNFRTETACLTFCIGTTLQTSTSCIGVCRSSTPRCAPGYTCTVMGACCKPEGSSDASGTGAVPNNGNIFPLFTRRPTTTTTTRSPFIFPFVTNRVANPSPVQNPFSGTIPENCKRTNNQMVTKYYCEKLFVAGSNPCTNPNYASQYQTICPWYDQRQDLCQDQNWTLDPIRGRAEGERDDDWIPC